MAYYTKVLLPDEQIRAMGRLHWAIYVRAWIALTFGLIAGLAALYYRNAALESRQDWQVSLPAGLGIAAVILLLAGFVWGLGAWIRRNTTEIVVTDRRVIFKEGFVRRRTMEMNTSKIETVDVIQSIGGRLLDYGAIVIRGTGSSYEPLGMIAEPLRLRTAIIAQ